MISIAASVIHFDKHNSCKDPIPCGRECTADDDSEESMLKCLNYLKEWCLEGEHDANRVRHMSWAYHQRFLVGPDQAVIVDARGDAMLHRVRARSDLPHLVEFLS